MANYGFDCVSCETTRMPIVIFKVQIQLKCEPYFLHTLQLYFAYTYILPYMFVHILLEKYFKG